LAAAEIAPDTLPGEPVGDLAIEAS